MGQSAGELLNLFIYNGTVSWGTFQPIYIQWDSQLENCSTYLYTMGQSAGELFNLFIYNGTVSWRTSQPIYIQWDSQLGNFSTYLYTMGQSAGELFNLFIYNGSQLGNFSTYLYFFFYIFYLYWNITFGHRPFFNVVQFSHNTLGTYLSNPW